MIEIKPYNPMKKVNDVYIANYYSSWPFDDIKYYYCRCLGIKDKIWLEKYTKMFVDKLKIWNQN